MRDFEALCFLLIVIGILLSPTYAVDYPMDLTSPVNAFSNTPNKFILPCSYGCGILQFQIDNNSTNNKSLIWRVKNPSGVIKESGTCPKGTRLVPIDGILTTVTGNWWLEIDVVSPTQSYSVEAFYEIPKLQIDPFPYFDFHIEAGSANTNIPQTLWVDNIGPDSTDLPSWTASKSGSMINRVSLDTRDDRIIVTVNASQLTASGVPYILGTITVNASCGENTPQSTTVRLYVDSPIKYTLSSSVSPTNSGRVIPDPLPGSDGKYFANTPVTLHADSAGYDFTSWGGDISDSDRDKNPVQIVIDRDKSVVANFTPQVRYTLSIGIEPSGSGSVTPIPSPGSDGKYTAGTIVTLTADESSDHSFYYWSGSVNSADRYRNPIQVIMDGGKSLTAHYYPKTEYQNLGPNTSSGFSDDPVNTATGNFVHEETDLSI